MASLEIFDGDEWAYVGEDSEISTFVVSEENNDKKETSFDNLPEDELILSENIGEVYKTEISNDSQTSPENDTETFVEISEEFLSNMASQSSADEKPKPCSALSYEKQEITGLDSQPNVYVKLISALPSKEQEKITDLDFQPNAHVNPKLISAVEKQEEITADSQPNALVNSKLISVLSGEKQGEITDLDSRNLEKFEYDNKKILTRSLEYVPKLVFEGKNKLKEINFRKQPKEELFPFEEIGDISTTEIPDGDQENRTKITGKPTMEIVVERNANVISHLITVLSGENQKRMAKVHLRQKNCNNTKWLMEYNEDRGQKPKIMLTELTGLEQEKVNTNRSFLMFGLMTTGILFFALGYTVGGWNRNLEPNYAIFEFDLNSVTH